MCGIAGFLTAARPQAEDRRILERMTGVIAHRGPDADGHWIDPSGRVALGHRRLSILELSELGAQPMHSRDQRHTVTFNGEIYNFQDLRSDLGKTGVSFRGGSDTEVMLELISSVGVEKALPLLNGMFAFAVWDAKKERLTLARDRYGEKPLYYGWIGERFVFGSELKSFHQVPGFQFDIDRSALTHFVRMGYVPAPLSIFSGINKLAPGQYLQVSPGGRASSEPVNYDPIDEMIRSAIQDPIGGNEAERIEELDRLLKDAVKIRSVADVPLGALLSGGIDSTLIVALMQAQSSRKIRTFSIGFHEKGYNEADHAKRVADHLGTDHTEHYVTAEEAMSVIPRLPDLYDEPFADSSQIPTYLVSALARKHVTVALSGDAGDELFGGYNRHVMGPKLMQLQGWIPKSARTLASAALRTVGEKALGGRFDRFLPVTRPQEQVEKVARIIRLQGEGEVYLHMVSSNSSPEELVQDSKHFETEHSLLERMAWLPGFATRMMALDLKTYLPDDILAKVDRASMGVSLETRVPYLDPRVVRFAWRLPLEDRIRGSTTKWILRQVLDRYVPRDWMERPKMGFGVPIDHWLREPLRGWVEALIDRERLEKEGYFKPEEVWKIWMDHRDGNQNRQHSLWNILMFQQWLERWRPGGAR